MPEKDLLTRRLHGSLEDCRCPECKKGTLQCNLTPDYDVPALNVKALTFVNRCDQCGFELVTEEEWEQLLLHAPAKEGLSTSVTPGSTPQSVPPGV